MAKSATLLFNNNAIVALNGTVKSSNEKVLLVKGGARKEISILKLCYTFEVALKETPSESFLEGGDVGISPTFKVYNWIKMDENNHPEMSGKMPKWQNEKIPGSDWMAGEPSDAKVWQRLDEIRRAKGKFFAVLTLKTKDDGSANNYLARDGGQKAPLMIGGEEISKSSKEAESMLDSWEFSTVDTSETQETADNFLDKH